MEASSTPPKRFLLFLLFIFIAVLLRLTPDQTRPPSLPDKNIR
jgi:hypothetical protein